MYLQPIRHQQPTSPRTNQPIRSNPSASLSPQPHARTRHAARRLPCSRGLAARRPRARRTPSTPRARSDALPASRAPAGCCPRARPRPSRPANAPCLPYAVPLLCSHPAPPFATLAGPSLLCFHPATTQAARVRHRRQRRGRRRPPTQRHPQPVDTPAALPDPFYEVNIKRDKKKECSRHRDTDTEIHYGRRHPPLLGIRAGRRLRRAHSGLFTSITTRFPLFPQAQRLLKRMGFEKEDAYFFKQMGKAMLCTYTLFGVAWLWNETSPLGWWTLKPRPKEEREMAHLYERREFPYPGDEEAVEEFIKSGGALGTTIGPKGFADANMDSDNMQKQLQSKKFEQEAQKLWLRMRNEVIQELQEKGFDIDIE